MAASAEGSKASIEKMSLKNRINSSSWQDAKSVDIDHPGVADLKSELDVFPELQEIDFYGGYRAPTIGYVPESARSRKHLQHQTLHMKSVRLQQVLRDFKSGHLTFIGPAGIGKTTLMKAIVRNVISRQYESMQEVEHVHFLQGRNLHSPEKISVAGLLLSHVQPPLTDEEVKQQVAFTMSNPSRVLFVIDSLDTLPFSLDDIYEKAETFAEAMPATIIRNLLCGNIFHGCRVITSSREHAIRNYKGSLRAQKVIALVGLTDDSIRKIIVRYLGKEEGEQIFSHLESSAPDLKKICSIPAFLSFTLIGRSMESSFTPKTMTGVLLLVLKSLIRSEHTRVENVGIVLNKLKRMAFTGTKEERVIFTTRELENYALKEMEVTDLVVLAPSGGVQRLLHTESVLYFCHQSMQELLTAACVADMDIEHFNEFVTEKLHKPQYAVVRRMLCGILLDGEITSTFMEIIEAKGAPVEQLKESLLQSMSSKIIQPQSSADLLELLISVHETDVMANDRITSRVRHLTLDCVAFSLSDMYAVASVLSHCRQIEKLELWNCNLDSEMLSIFLACTKDADLRIDKMDVARNVHMDCKATEILGKIVNICQVKKLKMGHCNLTSIELDAFADGLEDARLAWLEISSHPVNYCPNRPGQALYRLLLHATEELDARGCGLDENDYVKLQQALDDLYPSALRVQVDEDKWLKGKNPASISSEDARCASELRIGDCTITFPQGAFEEDTEVIAKLEIDSSKWPTNLIAITPMLYVDAANTLRKAASVRMTSWCKATASSDSKDLEIDVLHQRAGSMSWEVIETLPFVEETVFKFRTLDFSPFFVALRERFFGKESYEIEPHVFASNKRESVNFKISLHLKSEVVTQNILSEMDRQGYQTVFTPNVIDVKRNETIAVKLTCLSPGNLQFQPAGHEPFTLDERFIQFQRKATFDSFISLSDMNATQISVHLKCDISKNDIGIDKDRCTVHDWNREQAGGNEDVD